ncbi:MAG: PKD domain-containing protein, partial [Nocardioidaceae bacterium]
MSPSRPRRALLSLATVGGLLFGLLSFAASAEAATTSLYVDKTVSCSDTGSGTSSTPYCTIAKGVSQLQPGTTLYVGNGTYAETIKPTVSGTSSSPVTITGWPGRSPKIGNGVNNGAYVSARSYVVISNLTFFSTVTDGIYVTGSNHITISGNTVSDSGKPLQGQTAPGISLRNTSASTVSGNTSDHNSDHGIFLTSGSTGNTVADNETSFNANGWHRNANGIDVISPGNTILRNVIHDNEDSGIQFYTGGNDNLAALNVTYNNGDHGIDDFNVTGGRLIGNTVYHNCTSGINVEGTSGNYTVENNIAVDNAVYPAYNGIKCSRRAGNIGIWDSAPATTTANHNLVYLSTSGTMYVFGSSYTSLAAMQAAKGQEQDGVQANPGFVSASSGNFQLTEGSAAIDRGDSAVSGAQSSDILGNARVDDPNVPNTHASGPRLYDDLGAYEFQSSGTPPSKPTAALSVSPSSGTAPVQVTADASGSSDPQGQTLSYVFDWGDGSSTPSQSGTTATHTYSAAGSYTVTVTATDTTGLSDTATRTVTVTAPASAPTARLTVSPTSGTAPVQVTADASASTDPQGQALTYAFDWGDGSTTPSQSAVTANHTYTTAGTYTVTVTATDTTGLSGTATKTVTVTAASSAPTARLTVSPSSG